ncbi:MAG TPA: cobalamin-binding protein [Candidatus Limnocylindrales bacterium]|nr:cobalamin-binding protein [Candidatus Limnocylindrales bacterium]
MTQRLFAILAALVLLLGACGPAATALPSPSASPSISSTAAPFPVTVTDFQSRAVVIPAQPKRIVSIGPSNTEFLFALGAGDRVVGVDDFSDTPAPVTKLEKIGGVKVNVEKVISLRPDLVLSVKFSDGTIEKIATSGIPIVVVDPQGLGDVTRSAILLGRAVGADGDKLASQIDQQLQQVKASVAKATLRPRVFHEVDASDPAKPFTVGPGSYIQDLIELAGGRNVASSAGSAYPQISLEEIVRSDPEVIVLGDADYGTTVEQVGARTGWSGITAVKNKRVYPIADSLVSRPGPRVAEAATAYAKLLHPELFP